MIINGQLPPSPITALVYDAGGVAPAATLAAMAAAFCAGGYRVAGVIEQMNENPDGPCDVRLFVFGSFAPIDLSEDRGRGARGCRLDTDALMRAAELTRLALQDGADILLVNKFGKMEAEGSGFRDVIGEAVARGVPVVIGVPARNLDAFRTFAGDLSVEVQIRDRVLHHASANNTISTPSIIAP